MSILSALFGSKKRAKKATPARSGSASPPPSATKQKVRASSPTDRPGAPSRFRSLRRRSSANPYDTVQRRNSGDASRKKQASAAGGSGGEWRLPDLGFAGDVPGDKEAKSGLGLDNVGRVPTLTRGERGKLEAIRFGAEQIGTVWKVLGSVLRDSDLPGSILETLPADLEEQDHALRALSTLVAQPGTLSDFPSITSHFPSPSSADASTIWSDRLLDLARNVPSQVVASTLKWTLRRLPSLSDTPPASPLMPTAVYVKFVQAEHAASYPKDAYQTLLVPELARDVRQVLHEIFDVWAALTSRAEDRSGLGGRMSLLMGWWILNPGVGKSAGWEGMYAAWRLAARRVEHLFLAWIRHQSTTHTLPTRLLTLVEKYPFGHSEYSAETLPSPPPSTFTRRTLHLSLFTEQPLSKLTLSPADVLQAALTASPDDDSSLGMWQAVSSAAGPSGETEPAVESLVDTESATFLSRTGRGSSAQPTTTKISTPSRQSSFFEGRPDPPSLNRVPSNAKLLDTLAEEVGKLAESHSTAITLPRRHSVAKLLVPESSSTWDDFTKSGFAEDKDSGLNLALSPSASITTFASATRDSTASRANGWTVVPTPTASPSQKPFFASTVKYYIAKEEIVDTDDMFIAFTEDGQLDTSSSSRWPIYTLLRLKEPFPTESNDDVVERLLITIEYRASPTPPPATPTAMEATPPRSSSPSGESNFRFGSFGFKRNSSRPGFRSQLFGSSRSLSKDEKNADFITEKDTIYKNGTERSGNFGASVDELGQLTSRASASVVSLGSPGKKARKAVPLLDATAEAPTEATAPVESIPPEQSIEAPTAAIISEDVPASSTALTSGPSADTSPSDWMYGAEGGAHVVFIYTGVSGPYAGKLLRIRKISRHRGDPLESSSAIWRDELLPQLVPSRLLVEAEGVKVDTAWLGELLGKAEEGRAEERKANGSLVEEVGSEPRVSIMENLRVVEEKSVGTRVLSVEIKPKWGFLPSADSVSPPEAAAIKSKIGRYTLHQHYRSITSDKDTYDPLDLFSGDEEHIKRALVGLWGIWRETGGQANSFRVFVDGNIVHPDEADTQGSLLRVTAPILIPLLRRSDVLPVLRGLQASLDPTDISDIVARFAAAHPSMPLFDESVVPDIQPSELSAFAAKYLSTTSDKSPEWTLRESIIAYSLSAIFKDCSIIIRAVLSPSPEDGTWAVDQAGSTVKMLDLDLKPLKMKHWAELDEKIWKHWAETKGVEGSAKVVAKEEEVASARDVVEDGHAVTPSYVEAPRQSLPTESTAPAALASFISIPTVATPGVGAERIVPGGFPGIPDVPISTPGLDAGPSSVHPIQADLASAQYSEVSQTADDYSWHLQWYDGLEYASKLYFAQQDLQGMFEVLMPLHTMVERNPETAAQMSFAELYGNELRTARQLIHKNMDSSERELQSAWDLYYSVFQRLSKKLRSVGLVAQSPVLARRSQNVAIVPAMAPSSPGVKDIPSDTSHTSNILTPGASAGTESAKTALVPEDGSKDVLMSMQEASPDQEEVESKDLGEENGDESMYSSTLSTPLAPGAFNFPDTPSRALPVRQAPSAVETSADLPESTPIRQSPVTIAETHPVPTNSSPTRAFSPAIPIAADAAGLVDLSSEPETSSAESASSSPVKSRFERSFAPSPSPVPETTEPNLPLSLVDLTLTPIALNSPTFGTDLVDIDTVSIHSGSSVTAETIESGSSVTEESSYSPSRPFIDLHLPSTPERRETYIPSAPTSILGESSGTPTQRSFPSLGPIALGLPIITPRSSSLLLSESYQKGPSSPTGSTHSAPSRPERRRVDSVPRTRAASSSGPESPIG